MGKTKLWRPRCEGRILITNPFSASHWRPDNCKLDIVSTPLQSVHFDFRRSNAVRTRNRPIRSTRVAHIPYVGVTDQRLEQACD